MRPTACGRDGSVGPRTATPHPGEARCRAGREESPAVAARGQGDGADDRYTETGRDQHREDKEHHVTRVTDVTSEAIGTLAVGPFRHSFVTLL